MLRRPRPALTLLPALALALSLTACGDDGAASGGGEGSGSDAVESTAVGTPFSESGAAAGTASCSYESDGQEPAREVDPPPSTAQFSGEVPGVVVTNRGDLRLTLDADNAPCTVSSFTSLADQGYFDDTPCHRLTGGGSLSVLQCGDPLGEGFGGPGYQFDDELTGSETYPAGTLAMANAGPGTNGSQFFMVYADSQLPPAYTVFGTLDDDAVATLEEIADAGSTPEGDGAPNTDVEILGVSTE
ncbi:peptidylprolyl isomerase [Nocardioides nanhaiensis]|uniref:Peptidyl-prolyl cis-trans isomerase n=1 Tax=Nocardioides nanhaiensis TaxID=1476871 RepID=A0ABP8WPM0_9ACTN